MEERASQPEIASDCYVRNNIVSSEHILRVIFLQVSTGGGFVVPQANCEGWEG